MATLGCVDDYQIVIASKEGVVLGQFDPSTLSWGRVIDDISQATVVIPIVDSDCCDLLGSIHTFHHEVQIFRGGVYVWSGIVTNINGGRQSVTIEAQDIAILLGERIIHDLICFSDMCLPTLPGAAGDLTDIGIAIINDALEDDGHGYEIQSELTGLLGERLYQPGENSWSDLQEALVLGLDFTVLGRKMILGAANGGAPFGQTETLTCDDFLGDIQVEEDGLGLATRVICVGNGVVGVATAPGTDINGLHPYYGLLEYVDTSQSNLTTQDQVDAAAARIMLSRFPAPQNLIIPAGSALAPTAPIDINSLVPGTFTTIIADCVCRPITSTQVLIKLDVSWGPAGEVVQVTYGTLFSINASEGIAI